MKSSGSMSFHSLVSLLPIFISSQAFALGSLTSETWSFFRNDPNRANTVSSVAIGPRFEGSNPTLETKGDIKILAFIGDSKSITAEASELYFASKEKRFGYHQWTIGRRKFVWTELDEKWNIGIYSPRFMWDSLLPEKIGLTGAFYQFKTGQWNILGYASPLSIPERGANTFSCERGLCSSSPLFNSPPSDFLALNRTIPIDYKIQIPPLERILLRPSAALSVTYGKNEGVWVGAKYGFLPIHQTDLAFDASLNSFNGRATVNIYPRFFSRHLITGEVGFKQNSFQVWGSATQETPITSSQEEIGQIYNPMGPARILSGGLEFDINSDISLGGSLLGISEQSPPPVQSLVEVNLPSRFQFKRAWKIYAQFGKFPSLLSAQSSYTSEIEFQTSLISADVLLHPLWKKVRTPSDGLSIGLGTDFIAGNRPTGWFGQFLGNDRVRFRVQYAF